MPDQDSSEAARFWQRRAHALALKLNFHHWLARVVPLLFFLLTLVALLDLVRREAGLPSRWSLAALVLGTGVVAGWAWLRARRHFCTAADALVRLETVLGLHNRLSAAQAGVVPWPAPPENCEDGYAANWKTIAIPLAAGVLFLWSSHLVPVSAAKADASAGPISEPPEFVQVQSWINTLKADDLIEPDKLQEMQAALDKLRENRAEDWYSQNNLEAANSLKELAEQAMNGLSKNLDQASDTVGAMKEKTENSGDAASLEPMQDQLRSLNESFASGNLPLKRELLSQLKDAETTDKLLSASQLAALEQRLKNGAAAAHTAPKSNGGLSDEMKNAMMAAAMGHGSERREARPGPGGVGGGKKSAPLELQPRAGDTPQGPLTAVGDDDMSRSSLGDTIKVSAGAHTVNPADYQGVQQAGAAQVTGTGGEAVWRSTYDPQEADTLARFFK